MKRSNFASLIILILLHLVRSSNSERSQNESLRWERTFKYKPYSDCTKENDFNATHIVYHFKFLYFYFAEYVIRTKRIQIIENFMRKKYENDEEKILIIYTEFEYAYYVWMNEKPTILTFGENVGLYEVYERKKKVTKVVTYALMTNDIGLDGITANKIQFDEGCAGWSSDLQRQNFNCNSSFFISDNVQYSKTKQTICTGRVCK